MKFSARFNFFNNLGRERENSPALMIVIWIMYLLIIAANFTSVMDGIVFIIGAVCLFLDVKAYRRKY